MMTKGDKPMRKLCVLLLMLLCVALCLPCMAEEAEDPMKVEAQEKITQGIADMALEATGWQKIMMENTTIVSCKKGKEYVTVTVSIPTLKAGVNTKEKVWDDVNAYLEQAFAPIGDMEKTTEYAIRVSFTGKGANQKLSWKDDKSLSGYKKKVNSMAASAAGSYTGTQMQSALYRYLFPKAADMPKKKPDAMPAMEPLTAYCNGVCDTLLLTASQSQERLPAMLMLMQLTKVEAKGGLDAAELTVKVKDWQTMLANADASARDALKLMMGVPEMSREEISSVYAQHVWQACNTAYYATKGQQTVSMTVNLTAAVFQGVQAAAPVMEQLRAYNTAFEARLDGLMELAATLDYYPQVPLIDTQILSGAAMETGTRVYFDTSETDHAFVCILKDGNMLLKGFIHNGTRLMTTLEPGTYEVWCSYGPNWFGEKYAFGKEAFCGVFELEVPADVNMRITLENVDGNQAVQQITYEDFAVMLNQ